MVLSGDLQAIDAAELNGLVAFLAIEAADVFLPRAAHYDLQHPIAQRLHALAFLRH